jgi:hypothetical protein
MGSDSGELKETAKAEYYARWEAVEAARARELAAMTEERAREIIQNLGAADLWRARPDWSGLVEQQELFMRARRRLSSSQPVENSAAKDLEPKMRAAE